MVQPLEGKAGSHGTVTYYCNNLVPVTTKVSRLGHTEGGRYGGAGMPDIKAVILTLIPLWEAADTALLPQGMKGVPPSGKELMGIGLMPHVPDDLVRRGIKQIMQSYGKLHYSEGRSQVASGLRDSGDYDLSQLL